MSVFGHYKAYKKELTQDVFIKAIKRAERFINEGENTSLTTVKNLNRKPYKKTKKQKNLQYHLFDLEPYTVIKARPKNPGYIEPEAKEHLKGLAQEIWYWKQRVEKDNRNKFIKAFSFAFYSDKDKSTNSYIQFDDNGRLKRGCKKYWNFLKKEVSKISNIPIKELII
jgi:hypothetical protein